MSPIANMLTIIKNAQSVKHESVIVPFSRVKYEIALVMKANGFIADVDKKKKNIGKSEKEVLHIKLKYENSNGAIRGLKLISRPSRRIYVHKNDIQKIMSGQGASVISTSKGIMSGQDARRAGLGGELIFEIW